MHVCSRNRRECSKAKKNLYTIVCFILTGQGETIARDYLKTSQRYLVMHIARSFPLN
jgi:hypothetical protein